MIYFLGALCLVFLVLFLYAGKRIKELTDVAAAAERAEHEKALELKTLETKLQTTAEAHQELRQRYDALQQKADEAAVSLAAVKTERASLASELEKLQAEKGKLAEELRDSFRAVANDIMRERTEDLDKRTKETLSPLREDLKRFGEQVDKTYQEEARERFNLKDSIEKLILRSQEISQETTSLTRALRGDSKVQGDWGELVLERILDQSGLIRGEHYFVQETLRDESGAVITTGDSRGGLRPDVIVRYPNRGAIVIDSKVSLTAYARYVAAETEAERDQALKEHLLSLRKHINELSGKRYEEYTEGSPNFVMLFIPNEPAYTIALTHEPTLWEEAYRQNVVLINGTNLIAALRMAQDMWQRDSQQRNVKQIVEEASKLYGKFVSFLESFLNIEKGLKSAQGAFTTARNQLHDGDGNIFRHFKKIESLGVKPKKRKGNKKAQPIDILSLEASFEDE